MKLPGVGAVPRWLTPGSVVQRVRTITDRSPVLGDVIHRAAAIYGDAIFVDELGGDRLTFAQAADRVERWTARLAAGIEPGDRVVLATPNGYGQLLAAVAVSRAGGIPVPLNPSLSRQEIEGIVRDCAAALVVRDTAEIDRRRPNARPSSQTSKKPNSADLAALFYTSGTTGRPKGAALTHRSIVGSLSTAALAPTNLLQLTNGGPAELAMSLPIAHIMGFVAALAAALSGVAVRLIPRFHPVVVLDEIANRGCAGFIGVPTMYRMMEAAGADSRNLKSVRLWMSGADVMPDDLARRFMERGAALSVPVLGPLGHAGFVEGYGMVETGGAVLVRVVPPGLGPATMRGFGVAVPGFDIRVVDDEQRPVAMGDVGQLQLRGHGVLQGYWGDDSATASVFTDDGWLRTGDEVRRGPLGSVVFQARHKNVLKVGGYSVYPPEIEEILEAHPDVVHAVVVGAPDDAMGQVPWAAVVPTQDHRVRPDRLRRWATEQLADYKAPRRVVFVDSLPLTGTGKVQRDEVSHMLGLEPG